jgi:16S rRNA (uracil1498-N3)-methyltransferase
VRPRFHLPAIETGELDEDESAHLTRVLRLGTGDEIDVFDGRGSMFHARVAEVRGAHVRVELIEPAPAAPEAGAHVTLVMSVLKGDKMDDVVRDAVMMGAVAIEPVVAARSEISLAALTRGRRSARWQRIAVSSVKQCGRAVVPPIAPPRSLMAWLGEPRTDRVLVLREPSSGRVRPLGEASCAEAVHLLVGPEGGWSDEELSAFDSEGFAGVSLGGRTLRADAAPLAAMAALYEAWQAW